MRAVPKENRPQPDAPPTLAELVIDAYAAGEIELEQPEASGKGAPVITLPGGKVYNLATVARFLGWVKPSDGQATRGCRAAFDAYATGEIELAAVDPKTRKDAIYHVPGGVGTYTCLTVAKFLGWTVDKGQEPTRTCRIAFDAWHATLRLVRMPQVRRTAGPTMDRPGASARARRGG